jgi:hypothetical protein
MARRELHAADGPDPDGYATIEHLEALRADINDALQQISAQVSTRANPPARGGGSDGAMMAQIFQLQSEMRDTARAENERLRDELREVYTASSDPLEEIERAQRLVELLPQERDETKEMVMGALGMLAEVMSRDTKGNEEPSSAAPPGDEDHVPDEHYGPVEPEDPPLDFGAGSATIGGLDLVVVED